VTAYTYAEGGAFAKALEAELEHAEREMTRQLWGEVQDFEKNLYKAEVRVLAKDLRAGDVVTDYGVVEWIEVYDGAPNVLVDFVGQSHGTPLVRSLRLRVRR
jgi:hypothetical protein